METKVISIKVPNGFIIDEENSTFSKIVLKHKPYDMTFKKLKEEQSDSIQGYRLSGTRDGVGIAEVDSKYTSDSRKHIFKDLKCAKSALALAQISQLMPYYGGVVSNRKVKSCWCIIQDFSLKQFRIQENACWNTNGYLRFYDEDAARGFAENNEQLIRDYLMIEER